MLQHHGSFRKDLIFTDFPWQGGVVWLAARGPSRMPSEGRATLF